MFDVDSNYLIMELIDGPTLADRIKDRPKEGTHEHEKRSGVFFMSALLIEGPVCMVTLAAGMRIA
jgi:hypothetical protein